MFVKKRNKKNFKQKVDIIKLLKLTIKRNINVIVKTNWCNCYNVNKLILLKLLLLINKTNLYCYYIVKCKKNKLLLITNFNYLTFNVKATINRLFNLIFINF